MVKIVRGNACRKQITEDPCLKVTYEGHEFYVATKEELSLRASSTQHIEGHGVGFFQEICRRDLEGIVCKRKGGIYKSNGTGWLKVKNPKYSQAEGRGDLFKRDTGHSDDTVRR